MQQEVSLAEPGKAAGAEDERGSREAEEKQSLEDAARAEAMRNSILSQVLDNNARARLGNIAAVKPEKAKMLENVLINMARFGQIAGKLTDEQFKSLIDRIAGEPRQSTSVKFDRRKAAFDLDEDED